MHQDWQEFLSAYPAVETMPAAEDFILCHLADMGVIQVSGQDAKKLLQGQLTCDLNKVTSLLPSSSMGAHCSPQGRVISLFYICAWHSSYYLIMPNNLLSLALAALKKYAVFYKVELDDVSQTLIALGCSNNSLSVLAKQDLVCLPVPDNSQRSLLLTTSEQAKSSWEMLAKNAAIITHNAWNRCNIQHLIPRINASTSGKFLPHELNLEKLGAIDFAKGCYTGQEIIARMHYRGKLKNQLSRARMSSHQIPTPGEDIFSVQNGGPKVSGSLIDVVPDHPEGYFALVLTDTDNAQPKNLFLQSDAKAFFTFP